MSRSVEDVKAEQRAAALASRTTPTLATTENGLNIQFHHSNYSDMTGPPTG